MDVRLDVLVDNATHTYLESDISSLGDYRRERRSDGAIETGDIQVRLHTERFLGAIFAERLPGEAESVFRAKLQTNLFDFDGHIVRRHVKRVGCTGPGSGDWLFRLVGPRKFVRERLEVLSTETLTEQPIHHTLPFAYPGTATGRTAPYYDLVGLMLAVAAQSTGSGAELNFIDSSGASGIDLPLWHVPFGSATFSRRPSFALFQPGREGPFENIPQATGLDLLEIIQTLFAAGFDAKYAPWPSTRIDIQLFDDVFTPPAATAGGTGGLEMLDRVDKDRGVEYEVREAERKDFGITYSNSLVEEKLSGSSSYAPAQPSIYAAPVRRVEVTDSGSKGTNEGLVEIPLAIPQFQGLATHGFTPPNAPSGYAEEITTATPLVPEPLDATTPGGAATPVPIYLVEIEPGHLPVVARRLPGGVITSAYWADARAAAYEISRAEIATRRAVFSLAGLPTLRPDVVDESFGFVFDSQAVMLTAIRTNPVTCLSEITFGRPGDVAPIIDTMAEIETFSGRCFVNDHDPDETFTMVRLTWSVTSTGVLPNEFLIERRTNFHTWQEFRRVDGYVRGPVDDENPYLGTDLPRYRITPCIRIGSMLRCAATVEITVSCPNV